MDSAPSCRPWERGDLLRRLATFKPSTWASKPKAASSLACAQRGWVNIDLDKIECESCGAHLIFNALMSWSPVEGMFFLGSLFDGFTTMQSSWSLCVPVLCLFALLLTVREESTFCFE